MFKRIMKSALVGAAIFALAAPAAADVEINLYGASAQFLYWNDAADNFLAAQNCTGIQQFVAPSPNDKTHGLTYGTCGTAPNTYRVIIRYSSKASFDGICAIKGHAAGAPYNCETGCGGSQFKRNMCNYSDNCATTECVDVTLGASDVAGPSFIQSSEGCIYGPRTKGAPEGYTYIDPEEGPITVAYEGCRNYPVACGSAPAYGKPCWIARSFSTIDTSGLTVYNPLVVPFGFFANNTVTKTRCIAPEPKSDTLHATADKAMSAWGAQCYPLRDFRCKEQPDKSRRCDGGPQNGNLCTYDLDCGTDNNAATSLDCVGYYKCVGPFTGDNGTCSGGVNFGATCQTHLQCPDANLADTRCQAIPINNISRLMATMIFSGQAKNWSDFGAFYPAGPIVACLRHAGSGTQATLQLAVMKGNGWGWPLLTYQNQGGNTQNWFNDGSGDMMKCISGPGAGDPVAWNPAWSSWYAIGFADADQLTGKVKDFSNVHALNYQGVEPKRWKIRNGEYDFWSYQWIYQDPNEANPNNDNSWVTSLMNYAKEPENVPFSKVDYWATEKEMKYKKAGTPSADYAYPGKAPTVAEPLVP